MAGLAHDLGHPPFGHLAEEALARLVRAAGNGEGFEGNAQTFRILTALADNHATYNGLNLTKASLQATLKYPWLYTKATAPHFKFGAYSEDKTAFHFAIGAKKAIAGRSIEAEVMDYADDVTYALYDLHDFIISGHIPFGVLVSDVTFFESYFGSATASGTLTGLTWLRAEQIHALIASVARLPTVFEGTGDHSKALRTFINRMLGRYLSPGQFDGGDAVSIGKSTFVRAAGVNDELRLLKSFTRHYVINHHSLGTKQAGHRRIVETLYKSVFLDGRKLLAGKLTGCGCLSPWAYEHLKAASTKDLPRRTADIIASMTEDQAVQTYRAICGL